MHEHRELAVLSSLPASKKPQRSRGICQWLYLLPGMLPVPLVVPCAPPAVEEGELSPFRAAPVVPLGAFFPFTAFFPVAGRSKSPDFEVPCAPLAVEDGALDCATAKETDRRVAALISAILLNIGNSLALGLLSMRVSTLQHTGRSEE